MKLLNKSIQLSVSLAALFFAQSSFAAGDVDANATEAGTVVSNTATLSYSVGGATQTDITSKDESGNDATTFTVDQKVDLTVTGASADPIKVGPSSDRAVTGNKLTYTLSNEGNFNQRFKIDVSHLANTGTEFNAGETTAAEACQFNIIVDGNAISSTPYAITDTPVVILGTGTAAATGSTAPATSSGTVDKAATIEVMCAMPDRPGVSDGDQSVIDVLATAVDSSGDAMVESGADRENEIDVVLADGIGAASDTGGETVAGDTGDRNAKHSDTQTFEIDAPMLSVLKTSKVISDPFNGSDDPKRIPGAIIEYTIAISNTSDSEATDVTITDSLDAVIVAGEVKFVANSIVIDSTSITKASSFSSNVVTATGITVPVGTLAAPSTAKVTFQVEIL